MRGEIVVEFGHKGGYYGELHNTQFRLVRVAGYSRPIYIVEERRKDSQEKDSWQKVENWKEDERIFPQVLEELRKQIRAARAA